MPNNEAMTGLDPKAYRPPNAVWNGTDIRLQTEFLIAGRLKPGLEAGGSSLKNAIKAQVYLTDINDLPEFMDVWNGHFTDSPCALTVVATKGLALLEFEDRNQHFRRARCGKNQEADHRAQSFGAYAPRARGGVRRRSAVPVGALCGRCRWCAAGCECVRWATLSRRSRAASDEGYPWRGRDICQAGGTSLANVVRAHHFVGDLNSVYPALRIWQEKLAGAPIPFGAVRTSSPMPIPGCDIIMDMWAYRPTI